MSEPNQEPTMEEILASIRRIISEDEAPADGAAEEAAAEPEEEDLPVEALDAAPDIDLGAPEELDAGVELEPEAEDEEVLELTERISGPEPDETHGDIDVYAAEPEPAPRPQRAAPAPEVDFDDDEPLLGATAAAAATSAFGQLARTISMPADGRTLEDVVRELLRPLLKAWLDENLPAIVQARVDAEVERISRAYRG